MRNICRPITFYNNFVPPSNIQQKWEYEALGYYDGITVGEDLAKDEAFNLNRMWTVLAEQAKSLNGNFTSQTIHIFRTERGNEVITDQKFWENRGEDDEKPFLFIVMLRLKKKAENLPKLKQNVENKLKREGIDLITYLSLDNNDLIVILRSREYLEGTRIIDGFHQNARKPEEVVIPSAAIYDSFSICGVNKKCLNSPDYRFFHGEMEISRVCLRVIEKKPGSVRLLDKRLQAEFGKEKVFNYPVLGCEDEVFLLENIPFDSFWKQYRDNDGILSSSNASIYKKSVIGITALVLQGREDIESVSKTPEQLNADLKKRLELEEKKGHSIWDEARETCVAYMGNEAPNNLEEAGEVYRSHVGMYYKAILQIINSLQKYENMKYKDHIYIVLHHPMRMLIELLKEMPDDKREEMLKEISDFFYAINLLTQNSVRLERQFIQSVELNARIYEAPVQLSTFYSVYFAKLRDVLNEGVLPKHDYEFMICPGMAKYLNVKRLLPHASREKRLLLVEIPERQMYDVKNQLVIMAHETAHFVGTDIRLREQRYDYMLKAIVKSVSTFLILDEDMNQYCTKSSIQEFDDEYYNALKREVSVYCDGLVKLSQGERRAEDHYHTEFMKEDLWRCAQNVLLGEETLLNNLCLDTWNIGIKKMNEENNSDREKLDWTDQFTEEFEKNRNKFLIKMMIPNETMTDERCICKIVENNIHIFKEAFADFLSILLLELEMDAYLDAFLESSIRMRETEATVSGACWRMAIVIKAMQSDKIKKRGDWSNEKLRELANNPKNSPREKLAKTIAEILVKYLSGNTNILDLFNTPDKLKANNKNMDRLFNSEVCDIFCEYLILCGKKFCEKEESGAYSRENLFKLREIYQKLSHVEEFEGYILYIRMIIEEYVKEMTSELH